MVLSKFGDGLNNGKGTYFQRALAGFKVGRTFRQLTSQSAGAGDMAFIDGQDFVNLTSNNYLGMSQHPEVIAAAQSALEQWGVGSGGSRLLSGSYTYMDEFESGLAYGHRAPRALLFNSGYAANTGIIPAIAKGCTHIFSDRANHASIVDGILLSRKPFTRYRHGALDHLADLLANCTEPEKSMVITETLFSMDGDFTNLEELLKLQKRYGFFLYLDEAHGFGGYPEYLEPLMKAGYRNRLVVGTFGKALAGFGAFTAAEAEVIEYLINTSRTFIFSTALPPAVIMAAQKSFEILREDHSRQNRLHGLSGAIRQALKSKGVDIGPSNSHIVPIITGANRSALQLASDLRKNGYYAVAIRPPTVPKGSARVRLCLNARIKESMSNHLVETILQSLNK